MEAVLNSGNLVFPFSNKENAQENFNLKSEKISKRKVIAAMRDKLEETKLSIIKEKFIEKKILYPDNVTSIKELKKELKKALSALEYTEANSIIQSVSDQFNAMVNSLEAGSKTAFTKLMNSPASKSIAKSLGISLTGRTLLVLAPDVLSKILVAAGMGGYYVINGIKNKKSVKEANISNELNHILLDLEATKIDDKYADTRFNEECQNLIKEFLNKNNIYYTYIGYKSLMNAVYGLNNELKLKLVNELNLKLAKGEDIDKRIKSAGRKLNVVATTVMTAGIGLEYGTDIATKINSISPALTAAPTNAVIGGVFGNWLAGLTGKTWLTWLTSGLSGVGTAVLGFFDFGEKILATENFAVLGTLGTTIGLAVGPALMIVSGVKDIVKKRKLNKKFDKYNKLDAEKYHDDDVREMELIKDKANRELTMEDVTLDVVLGFFKDNKINLNGNPQNMKELNYLIDKLPGEEKKRAKKLLDYTSDALLSNWGILSKNLKNIASTTGALMLAGFSSLSIYDLIKGGTFLPELSKKMFPDNNIHTPVMESYNNGYETAKVHASHSDIKKFADNVKNDCTKEGDMADQLSDNYGAGSLTKDSSFAEVSNAMNVESAAIDINFYNNTFGRFEEWICDFLGINYVNKTAEVTKYVDATKFKEYLNTLKPQEIGQLKYYIDIHPKAFQNIGLSESDTNTIKSIVDEYVSNNNKIQNMYDFVNNASNVVGNAAVPISFVNTSKQEYEKDNSHLKR